MHCWRGGAGRGESRRVWGSRGGARGMNLEGWCRRVWGSRCWGMWGEAGGVGQEGVWVVGGRIRRGWGRRGWEKVGQEGGAEGDGSRMGW